MRATGPLLLVSALLALAPHAARCQSPPDLSRLASDYHIEIDATAPEFPVECTYGRIDGHAAKESEVLGYTRLFIPEFSLYPADLIRKSNLKRVVLCTDLSFAGQRRNAIPDFEHDTLYLDVSRGSYSPSYLRKVIHHEFFHIIDYKDDGNLYQDQAWTSLNPDGFRYGDGGRNAQDNRETSVLSDRYPGFLNHYSTTAVEEDKAELFANLLVDPDHVDRRASADPVVESKVDRMRDLLAKFCPAMNGSFWRRARDLRRTDP